MLSTNASDYRFQENDLTGAELQSLAEIAKTAQLKVTIPEKHARKLVMLRYAERRGAAVVATNRGLARLRH